uniref:Presenilin n=2 Tax=Wuchereria bancrofti TaxID=6293 RepID=A0AAF5PT07_WUCBA
MLQTEVGEMSRDEEEILAAIEHWTKQLKQVESLLVPVTLNIMLTLIVWIGVYHTKTDSNSVFYYMLDPGHNRTTGNEIVDGMVNGIGCVLMLAVISFALLAMALYDYRCLVQIWLYMSCVLIIFGVFASFLVDLFKAIGFQTAPPILTTLTVITYGTVGILVFFTKKTPLYMHQFYVICNCSLVSVFYLRMFPTHTAWFVLVCIIIWDAFAVLAPIGPLRRISEKAHEYSDQVLRFLIFTAEDRNDERREEIVINKCLVESKQQKVRGSHETSFTTKLDSEAKSERIRQRKVLGRKSNIHDETVQKICAKLETFDEQKKETNFTVYDALSDGSSVRLGMGDFVFYSLLVGKAAATGSTMCVAGSVVGILVGLVITLTVLSSDDETTPALPVSITIALLLHFGIYLFVEPFYNQIVISSKLFILL